MVGHHFLVRQCLTIALYPTAAWWRFRVNPDGHTGRGGWAVENRGQSWSESVLPQGGMYYSQISSTKEAQSHTAGR